MNIHSTCCRSCGSGVEVQKQIKRNGFMLLKRVERASFLVGTSLSLIMMITLMLAVGVSVLGDDTQAFQDTLSSLCSLNKEGHFGSCCESYDISSVTFASSPARDCFISGLSYTDESLLTFLFVPLLYLRILYIQRISI